METEEEHKEETVSEEKQTSKTKSPVTIYAIIAIVIIAVAGVAFFAGHKTSASPATQYRVLGSEEQQENQSPPRGNRPGGDTTSLVGQKFSDTQVYASAHLIAPGTLSADAKAATDGFDIQSTNMSDGSIQITLVPTQTRQGYQPQSFVVKPGYKLYFVEMSHGDDQPSNVDTLLRDDFAVLVDQSGTVIQ